MRTLQFLGAGLLLLAAMVVVARLFAAHYPGAPRIATFAFVAIWAVVAAANLWVGVARAGYSVTDELPIFLLVFGVPAAAALLGQWRLW